MRRALILASASPQRREILAQLGYPFEVRPAGVEELTAGEAHAVARENAVRKARAIAANAPGRTVLGVDTVVALDDELFGKPADAAAAAAMLARLAGRAHDVVSGLALVRDGALQATTQATTVTFAALDEAARDWYVATGEWRGGAGGYAIQGRGALLVDAIAGDYLNVVGLPVRSLRELLGPSAAFAATF